MRNNVVRAYALGIITGAFLTAGIVFAAGPAKADGVLDSSEADYVLLYGDGAVCPVIDEYGTKGVLGVMKGVMNDGFTPDSAVDIINESVQEFCPRNWPLLVAIGNAARGTTA